MSSVDTIHPANTGGSTPSNTSDTQKPSHQAIDHNKQSKQKPVYLVLDDINVDIITVLLTGTALLSYILLRSILVVSTLVAAIILLRTFLPIARKPEGTVLITGASSGIGRELANVFAQHGHKKLLLVGRNDEKLDEVKSEIQRQYNDVDITLIDTDLSVPGSAKKLYQEVKNKGIQIDVLCNNAGLGHAGDVMQQDTDIAETIINLNCIALVELTQLFGRDMISRNKGWILQTSSIVGWIVGPGQNIYHASKHFVRAFSEALSVELRGTNVINTQLMPGPVHTQFGTRADLTQTATFSYGYWGIMENPGKVAKSGYEGLCKNKRMVFSTWNAALTALSFHLMPRSVALTLGSIMNTPTEYKMPEPKKYQ